MKRISILFLLVVFGLVACKDSTSTFVTPSVEPTQSVEASVPPTQTVQATEEPEGKDIVKPTKKPNKKNSDKSNKQGNGKGNKKNQVAPTDRPNKNNDGKKKPSGNKATPKPTKKPKDKKTPKPSNTSKPKPAGPTLFINEICASNGEIIQDELGKYEDWFEIYNAGDKEVNLYGYYVSDKEDNLTKFKLPDLKIKPGGHVIIWASGKQFIQSNGEIHTNFKLKKSGEAILLVAPDGTTIVDQVPARVYERDTSYGRSPSGGSKWVTFQNPTPGKPN